jgi:hypothetical protein
MFLGTKIWLLNLCVEQQQKKMIQWRFRMTAFVEHEGRKIEDLIFVLVDGLHIGGFYCKKGMNWPISI